MEITLKSLKDTQKLAKSLAAEWLKDYGRSITRLTLKGPLVVALQGDLGSGKTTFLQFFARMLGIEEKVLSPSFLIIKTFRLPKKIKGFKFLVHIDAYRLKTAKELISLGFKDILRDQESIVAIEWPEKVSRYLPRAAKRLCFEVTGEKERKVTVQ